MSVREGEIEPEKFLCHEIFFPWMTIWIRKFHLKLSVTDFYK